MRALGLIYTLFFALLLAEQLAPQVSPDPDEPVESLAEAADTHATALAMSRLSS